MDPLRLARQYKYGVKTLKGCSAGDSVPRSSYLLYGVQQSGINCVETIVSFLSDPTTCMPVSRVFEIHTWYFSLLPCQIPKSLVVGTAAAQQLDAHGTWCSDVQG